MLCMEVVCLFLYFKFPYCQGWVSRAFKVIVFVYVYVCLVSVCVECWLEEGSDVVLSL